MAPATARARASAPGASTSVIPSPAASAPAAVVGPVLDHRWLDAASQQGPTDARPTTPKPITSGRARSSAGVTA